MVTRCLWRHRLPDIEIAGAFRILDRLFAPITALAGIGPQTAKLFGRLCGPLVVDLVWHLPTGIVVRRGGGAARWYQT